MKPAVYVLTALLFFAINTSAQEGYTSYMEQGRYYYGKERYVSALQKFDLAYENASSDIRKKDAKTWKNKSLKSLKNQQTTIKKQLESNKQELDLSRKLINVFYFYDDKIALAYKNGKYGYILKNGKVKIPFNYDQATPFEASNGFARVQREGKSYLIDTTGKEFLLASNSLSLNGKVEALDLRNQHLSKLPDYVFDYVGLKILLLSNNNLSFLPENISRLKEITHLDLSNNKLQEIPNKIGEMTQLQHLSLQNNFITRLPSDIVFVKNLVTLNLSNNKIYTLPNNMGSLFYLSNLILDGNKLKSLPDDIGHMRSLKTLSIKNNLLEKIPVAIASLYHLRTLHLDQNNITDLPIEISRLPQLKGLHLSRNKLGYLPVEMKQLASLERLELQGNPIPASKKSLIEGWLPNCAILF